MKDSGVLWPSRSVLVCLGQDLLATVLILMAVSSVGLQPGSPGGSVWVADEGANSLTVLDAKTNRVITTLVGIGSPHNVQLSPDNRTVWAVSGSRDMALAIDAETYAVKGAVPTGAMPVDIVLTPDGRRVYVANGGDNSVTAIDAATMKPVATIPAGKLPDGLKPSPDGRWVFVANRNDTKVSVIETSTNTRVAAIEVGRSPAQVAFSPDGRFAYVSLYGENAVVKIDVVRRVVIGRLRVGDGPVQVFVSPDNKYLLVSNQGTTRKPGTTVSVVGTRTFSVVKTVETGEGAHGVVVDPSSRHAYITNIFGNTVAVLDLAQLRITATVSVGSRPDGITFSSLSPSPASAPGATIMLPDLKKPHPAESKH